MVRGNEFKCLFPLNVNAVRQHKKCSKIHTVKEYFKSKILQQQTSSRVNCLISRQTNYVPPLLKTSRTHYVYSAFCGNVSASLVTKNVTIFYFEHNFPIFTCHWEFYMHLKRTLFWVRLATWGVTFLGL